MLGASRIGSGTARSPIMMWLGANADKKDIYAEAESRGYDKKAIKQLVALRRKDPAERQATEAILETYKAALGMI